MSAATPLWAPPPKPGALHRGFAPLRVFLSALTVLGAACWLCVYPVMMGAAGLTASPHYS